RRPGRAPPFSRLVRPAPPSAGRPPPRALRPRGAGAPQPSRRPAARASGPARLVEPQMYPSYTLVGSAPSATPGGTERHCPLGGLVQQSVERQQELARRRAARQAQEQVVERRVVSPLLRTVAQPLPQPRARLQRRRQDRRLEADRVVHEVARMHLKE